MCSGLVSRQDLDQVPSWLAVVARASEAEREGAMKVCAVWVSPEGPRHLAGSDRHTSANLPGHALKRTLW